MCVLRNLFNSQQFIKKCIATSNNNKNISFVRLPYGDLKGKRNLRTSPKENT